MNTHLLPIHAEECFAFGVRSRLLVSLDVITGELVITERFDSPGGHMGTKATTRISAAGAQRIADALRPPPETETHGGAA